MNLFNFLKKIFTFSKNKNFVGILAAKVVEIQKHPNADRLRIIKLDIGNKIIEPVVCGAFNFEAGNMVALALPGAIINKNIHSNEHESFVLKKAKIRGVESQGMICASFELGLDGVDNGGIMILKNNVQPGSKFTPKMIYNKI